MLEGHYNLGRKWRLSVDYRREVLHGYTDKYLWTGLGDNPPHYSRMLIDHVDYKLGRKRRLSMHYKRGAPLL